MLGLCVFAFVAYCACVFVFECVCLQFLLKGLCLCFSCLCFRFVFSSLCVCYSFRTVSGHLNQTSFQTGHYSVLFQYYSVLPRPSDSSTDSEFYRWSEKLRTAYSVLQSHLTPY